MASRVLLVEGREDRHVVCSLLKHYDVPKVFKVEEAGGDVREDEQFDRAVETVDTRLRVGSDLERLAVVLDADQHIDRRWQSLRDRLSRSSLCELPPKPNEDGTVIELSNGRGLGLWLMPNNGLGGMIEDFLARLVPADDVLLPHVDAFLDGLPKTRRRFRDVHRPKARIHAWLSVQDEPDGRLGLAITRRCLDADAPDARRFVQWVQRALVD